MILRNVLLVVKDIECSRRFYQDILGLTVTVDMGKKMIFNGGIVIEEASVWEDSLQVPVVCGGNNTELYFEDTDITYIREKLEKSGYNIGFLMSPDEDMSEILRFYDPDKHIIEIRSQYNEKAV